MTIQVHVNVKKNKMNTTNKLKKIILEEYNKISNNMINEGFPIQCCNAQGNPQMYTVPSANQGCSSLGLTDPPCTGIVVGPDQPFEDPDDPIGDDGTTNSACSFDLNSSCAVTHDLVNRFVNNNPTNFLNNMEDGYTTNGCSFLVNRIQNHQNQINNNLFFGPNNPQGAVPGPNWINQKQSKVDFLNCVYQACCTSPVGGGPGGKGDTGVTNTGVKDNTLSIKENKNMKTSKKILSERFQQLAGIKPLYEVDEQTLPGGVGTGCEDQGSIGGPYPSSYEPDVWSTKFDQKMDNFSSQQKMCTFVETRFTKFNNKLSNLESQTPKPQGPPAGCNPKFQSMLMHKIKHLQSTYGSTCNF